MLLALFPHTHLSQKQHQNILQSHHSHMPSDWSEKSEYLLPKAPFSENGTDFSKTVPRS